MNANQKCIMGTKWVRGYPSNRRWMSSNVKYGIGLNLKKLNLVVGRLISVGISEAVQEARASDHDL